MIKKWLPAAPLLLSLIFVADGVAGSTELTGVLTQVDGTVQLAGLGVNDLPVASLWQVIHAKVTVRVPEGGAVGVVCSNRHFVRLQGPASWSLTEKSCLAGRELTPGEYALVVPQAGRFKVVSGLLTLEREIRVAAGDDSLAPLLLSPRNTVLRSPRPSVSWLRLPAAAEYRVEWSGRRSAYDTRLVAGDVVCAADRGGADVCSLPWPSDRPDLAPDETFFLRIAARGGTVEPWHWTDPVEVRTPRVSAAATLEGRLRDLESLGLEGPALEMARAGLLAQGELYADAAEAYRQALAAAPTPELHATLGDVYLAMGLLQFAEPRYREAARDGGPSVQAAAAFGLGRIEYARARYREAAMDFRQARELFAGQNLGEEETAARQAAERATARALKN
ncbi:MAG TPA: hypothetical protein VGS07_23610 [Thermoanaerobaculia bacterium]|jgi:hypothetical protein|nr:hypothetical protein [Thermoanaerobaculia bacterium]